MFGEVSSLIAVLIAFVGIFLSSEATFGVAIIGFCGVLGIFARIMQANMQHKALMDLIEEEGDARALEAVMQK